jgi:regulator of protease activity HflC (stomatin/prohibitin superfamily)
MDTILAFWPLIPIIILVLSSIKQVNQYERGVLFLFGKYIGILHPGWRIVWPIIQSWIRIDIRTKAVDVPDQEAITKDNVSARINAVIYYRVIDAAKAVIEVENFFFAVSQLAQTTMRNVVGETSLDDLLSKRNEVAKRIKIIIDKATDAWGISVESVELKDIILPDEMRRVIAKQAEAERERRAIIIRADGEKAAAENIAQAAEKLAKASGGLHIRTLQTLNELSSDKSNTVVLVTPLEILRAFEGMIKSEKE